MLATSGFGILALFSLLSTLLGEERRQSGSDNHMAHFYGRWIR